MPSWYEVLRNEHQKILSVLYDYFSFLSDPETLCDFVSVHVLINDLIEKGQGQNISPINLD